LRRTRAVGAISLNVLENPRNPGLLGGAKWIRTLGTDYNSELRASRVHRYGVPGQVVLALDYDPTFHPHWDRAFKTKKLEDRPMLPGIHLFSVPYLPTYTGLASNS